MIVSSMLAGRDGAVLTVSPSDPISAAAKILSEKRIGALIVTDGKNAVAGILSERDIVRGLSESNGDVMDKPVSTYMTADVFTCGPDDTVNQLMEMMTGRRIRHLPVVHEDKLVGIISIGDVVKHKIQEAEKEAENLREYIATG
jgi:CBS domain-containing protein